MSNEKILVVDDEEDILELVRYNLAKEGYHVTGALTGEDGFEKIRSETFDLIVLDLMRPGIDGLEMAKRLKSNPKTEQYHSSEGNSEKLGNRDHGGRPGNRHRQKTPTPAF